MSEPKLVRGDVIRLGGDLTVTFEHEWSDGCVLRYRTRTSYAEAKVVRRNADAMKCGEHRRGG